MKKITFLAIFIIIASFFFSLKAEINFDLTTVGGTIVMNYDAVNAERNKAQAERWITVVNFGASGTSGKCGTATKTFDIKSGRTIEFFLAKCDTMIITANIASGRSLKVNIDAGADIILAGTGACVDYEVVVNKEEPVKIKVQGGSSSSSWTSFFTFTYAAKVPAISTFTAAGISAPIDQDAKTIIAELPYGTNLASIEPVVTLGGTAADYSPKGAQDFSAGPIVYSVTDGINTNDYTVTLTAKATPDTEKAISSMTINGRTASIDEATGTITCDFPSFEGPLANWPVVFALNSPSASADFTAGSSHDFNANNTLTITVTAQDLSTKVYTVSPTISTKKNLGMLTVNGKAESYDDILLSAFDDYYITFLTATATAPADINAFYANYDVLVFHANVGGTNATALASEAMVGVKPVLNLKVFFYNSGRWSWSTAAPQNAAAGTASSEVIIPLQAHPIFDNVNFDGTTLTFYDGLPASNTNAIQYASDLATLSGFTQSYPIAKVGTSGIQMHEIQDNATAKYLMIGLSMENNNFTYFNTNTVNLLKNSAAYLLSSTEKYDYSLIISSLNNASEGSSIYYSNGIIFNVLQQDISVLNSSGIKIINSNLTNIDVKSLPKGIYFVQTNDFKTLKFIK